MSGFFWAVFAVLSAIHIAACFCGKNRLQDGTKPFLLPCLFAVYLVAAPAPRPLVAAALLLGFAGDTFLIWKKTFVPGAVAFGLGHLCYFIALWELRTPADLPWVFAAAFLLLLAEPAILFWKIRRGIPFAARLPAFAYAVMIALMGALAAVAAVTAGVPGVLIFAGMLLFISSDSLLVWRIFGAKRETALTNGIVMITYLAAEALLTAGFIKL